MLLAPLATVLLLSTPGEQARPALVEALRIQLADVASVEEASGAGGSFLADRVAAAAAQVEASGAVLAVWLEPAATEGEVLLFGVSRHPERALVQVVRLPHGTEAELDRVIALKVGELVDAARASPEVLEPTPAAAPAAPATEPAGEPESSLGLVFEVGAAAFAGAGNADAQAGPALAAGGSLGRGPFVAEACLFWREMSDLDESAAVGRVLVDETAVGLGARALVGTGRWAGGLYAEGAVRVVEAHGTAADGRAGTSRQTIPIWSGGVEGRLRLARWLAVRAAGGVQGALIRHRFAVDGMNLIDLGRVGPSIQISLVISVP